MITIPSPVGGTFTVTIKDSTDTIVYGPATQTNAPFDPAITTAGDYTMYVDNGGAVDGVCFTIEACGCPDFVGATVRKSGKNYYLDVSFDFPEGINCKFELIVGSDNRTSIGFIIGSLSQFTSHTGTVYTYTYFLGTTATGYYEIRTIDDQPCGMGSVKYLCNGPTPTDIAIAPSGDGYALTTFISNDGSTCHTVTWNYQQDTPSGSTSSGTFTDTVTGTGPYTFTHIVTPLITGTQYVEYTATATDCCGITYGPFQAQYTPTCGGPTITGPLNIGTSGASKVLFFTGITAGDTCNTASVSYIQMNTGYTSGVANSGTAAVSNLNTSFIVNPNLTFPTYGGNINRVWYRVTVTTCCGTVLIFDSQHI